MDPGMAFGTGTHETTRMCGVFLERYVKKGSLVIDVGCGTGILSIIAAKLGAAHITAVDIDDVAVRTARENCRLNGVEEKVNIYRGALEDIEKEEKVDLIVANIIADIIFGFSESVPVYLKPGGIFITSGIIKERRQEIIDKYFSIGFSLEDELANGWRWCSDVQILCK